MKTSFKRILCVLLLLSLLVPCTVIPSAADTGKDLRILFTHDIHSHFLNAEETVDGAKRQYGGAARLKTLLDENRTDCSLYLDGGDFSMGTLLQTAFSTDAFELRILGKLGCDVTTFGNHEFDYGDEGTAEMLRQAIASGDPLPKLVASNMRMKGSMSAEQRVLADALIAYGAKKYTVLQKGGLKIAVFGLFGIDCLECAPTCKMDFTDYIEAAKQTVETIRRVESPDVVVCLSHSGTEDDGNAGEDVELAKAVPGIDVILSGHTHSKFEKPVQVGNTVLVCCGEYLHNLGVLDLTVQNGTVTVAGYKLCPCDGSVKEDPEMASFLEECKKQVGGTYLADENVSYDQVICRSEFDFMSLDDMYDTHQEYPFGNLIADSYLYEAERNGITDIDVALVGLGTIRDSFKKGDITTGQAFEICSLGVGADGSAGHPLLCSYITGEELKLLVELDASLGPLVNSIKMSYAGLSYTFNEERIVLDRVTEIHLVRRDGSKEEIDDGKLYKVCCNMYAANMLGMLNGLTKGILKIVPKFEDGTVVEDFYDCSLKNKAGKEIKEWVAFKNYLMSFPKKDGVPTIPALYGSTDNRKVKVSEKGLAAVKDPGAVTVVVIALPIVIIALVIVLICTKKKRKARKQARKAKKDAKTEENFAIQA